MSDRPWITAAETCECLLAYLSVGRTDFALELFRQAQTLRSEDGYYWTGIVYPEQVHFPGDERSTYTAAAVILAADALAQSSPASRLFTDHSFLPEARPRRDPRGRALPRLTDGQRVRTPDGPQRRRDGGPARAG